MRRAVTMLKVATAVLFLACGRETQDVPDATVDATVDAEAAETSTDAQSDKQWPIVYNIVDGGGDSPDCYYDGDIVHTCCNGQPCRGFCILDDGSVECNCYGIPGGCTGDWEGQPANLCCAKYRACTVDCGSSNGP
jgi:hypothetical protein